MEKRGPAWSWGGGAASTGQLTPLSLLESATPEAILGASTGRGVKVAIVDSGVDNTHPAVAGAVRGWAEPRFDEEGRIHYREAPHEDLFGHGTACAGVVHRIAPEAELYSVRVLGTGLTGRPLLFAAGLRWAIDNDMQVVNLSLGTTSRDHFELFHDLVDEAYYRGCVLVTAANNMPVPSAPSLFAAALSVACHQDARGEDPLDFYCNPSPPVEFGAPGIDVRLAWLQGGHITGTGNSFAAPYMSGVAALLRSAHPHLRPFEVKTLLRALARNVRPSKRAGQDRARRRPASDRGTAGRRRT
jgi:subtilisin family serine protease